MNTAVMKLDHYLGEKRRSELNSATAWMRDTDIGRASSHFKVDHWSDGEQTTLYVSVLPGGGLRYTKNDGSPMWSPLQDQLERLVRLVRLVHNFELISARSSYYDTTFDEETTISARRHTP